MLRKPEILTQSDDLPSFGSQIKCLMTAPGEEYELRDRMLPKGVRFFRIGGRRRITS